MKRNTLLLVDDDRHLLHAMSEWLREIGYDVETAGSRSEAEQALTKKAFDLMLCDVRLPDGTGFDVLEVAREKHSDTAVILITGYGTAENAVDAIKSGAFDYLTKPLIDEELQISIERALNRKQLIEENQNLTSQLDDRYGLDNIIGQDGRMRHVFDLVESVADTKATVLITGESGTGKSLIARAIHRRSVRRDGPFVEVACGALPETLLESELFGHVIGAFTGAVVDKIGKFKQADGGTIFLDEIGTASPNMQVKLLRVLQDFQFESVGGIETQTVDSRVILATNEDLEQRVADGQFRQDLYYRINVIDIELPALRQRVADIPLLAQYFINRACEDANRTVNGVTNEALASMQRYSWPGNVRELQNCMERAVLLGKRDLIGMEDLPPNLISRASVSVEPIGVRTLKQALEGPERQIILEVLESNNWNRQVTADVLGINRTTLYKKMKRLGLEDGTHVAP